MKKTQTVNIGGSVFNIDEDAFQKLSKYLKSIEKQFPNKEEQKEIMADIELRIAEIFRSKTSLYKEVISISDVDEMIAIVGEAKDFEEESFESTPPPKGSKANKRLYRDTDNQVIAGVCSGLGNYINLDPNIIRALFIISVFFLGGGVFLYIILWIIVPEAKTTAQKLEMKGEPVTLSNIANAVKEEFQRMRKSMNI